MPSSLLEVGDIRFTPKADITAGHSRWHCPIDFRKRGCQIICLPL
jgi:hypothetical protein